MHPIIGSLRKLGLYLLAWVPVAALLIYLIGRTHSLTWTETIFLVVPLCKVYAFLCLAAWYPCRATPIDQSSVVRLFLTHFTAAMIAAAFWVQAAKGIALAYTRWDVWAGLDTRIGSFLPLLWLTGVLLYVLASTFYYVLMAEQASREAKERALQAIVLARDAELKALRAQVNPHFLFNCLHSISALTSVDATRAREMCILLADFLRTTLRVGKQESITLEEELSLIRGYLSIEKVRFGERVQMKEDVEKETMPVSIPPLLLQPLVENAIRHGIANLPEGGVIGLNVHRHLNSVAIEVGNTFDPDMPSPLKTGLGLENVRRRLSTRYGDHASIAVSTEGNLFSVKLRIPFEANGQGA